MIRPAKKISQKGKEFRENYPLTRNKAEDKWGKEEARKQHRMERAE